MLLFDDTLLRNNEAVLSQMVVLDLVEVMRQLLFELLFESCSLVSIGDFSFSDKLV